MTPTEARKAICAALETGLENVQGWPYLVAELPTTPAFVMRRKTYKPKPYMGAPAPYPGFDIIALVDMATDERPVELDDLVDQVLAAIAALAIPGLKVKAEEVLEEEEFLVGPQSLLGAPIVVSTITSS